MSLQNSDPPPGQVYWIIRAQSGRDLGEDDIERFDDLYKRS